MTSRPDAKAIDNIVFDLGGVLINLDFARTSAAFRALGAADFDAQWTPMRQRPFFEQYERGELTSESFRDNLRHALELPQVDDAALDAAWSAMIRDMPAERLALLGRLRHRHRLFLLSNTNEIHLRHVETHACAVHGLRSLDELFEKAYVSFRIGARKPEPRAFQYVLEHSRLQADRTLFIDDMPINVEAARAVGMHAAFLPEGMGLETVVPAR